MRNKGWGLIAAISLLIIVAGILVIFFVSINNGSRSPVTSQGAVASNENPPQTTASQTQAIATATSTILAPTATATPVPVPTIKAGVKINGLDVGNLNREAARSALQNQLIADIEQHPLNLSFGDGSWSPSLADLGISFNLEESLDKAFALNTDSPILDVALVAPKIDPTKAKSYLDRIAATVNQTMVEPEVVLGYESGQLQITNSGKMGYQLNYDRTLEAIKAYLPGQKLDSANTPNLLVMQTIAPTISKDEIYNLKSQVQLVVSQPLTITYADKIWTLDQKTLANLLSLAPLKPTKTAAISANSQPATPLLTTSHFSLTISRDNLTGFVANLAKGLDQKPQEGQLGWATDHPIALTQSRNGLTVDVAKSVETLVQHLTADIQANRQTSLVVTILKPSLDTSNLNALGLKEMVGEGVSHYGGSIEARGHNIETGAKYLTGTFIKPHTTFSFLDTIGDISTARGYAQGYSIVADQTVPDVGGGICQVSTTTFRAAFFAGLPIVERHPHAYRVHWYEEMGEPVGFDAAVYEPGLDMRFANPYDTWLYLQAYTQGGYLHVKLYGTKVAGQTIELKASGPSNFKPPLPDKTVIDPALPKGTRQQLDYAQQGLDATITRVVKINGVETRTDKYFSQFAPWGNIYKVGGIPTPTPAPTKKP